jgi:choline dehydrogenase-like flavoprotein
MFVDTRQLTEGSLHEGAVCIIGGGAAGITLALEFDRRGIPTCLLESGGFESDPATQDLYRGDSIGLPYSFGDGCRSRFLGGSTNCWGGWCRPLEDHDFMQREWVPNSGWPFAKSELQPYYEKANDILRLGPSHFDTEFWVGAINNPEVRRIPFTAGRVVDGISQFSPPVRFGRDYRQELATSPHLKVYLYANVVSIETDKAMTVRRVTAKTLTGRSIYVSAKVFVLASGGIENARLLLASNKDRPAGLGNHNDMVGRYFMDHPRLFSSKIYFRQGWSRNILYDIKYHWHSNSLAAHGACVAAQFGLTPELQAKERVLNARLCFSSVYPGEVNVGKSLIDIRRNLRLRPTIPYRALAEDLLTLITHPVETAAFLTTHCLRAQSFVKYARFQVILEPLPDPNSRVLLSESRDELAIPRVKVDWRVGELVKRTVDRTVAIVADDLANAGVADVVLDPPIEGSEWPMSFEKEGCWHHMGTTRMHDSPKQGVVDHNCRVYETNNLYVAGSSVFPTVGGNFPTITIVALAVRLACHIVETLDRSVVLTSSTAASST